MDIEFSESGDELDGGPSPPDATLDIGTPPVRNFMQRARRSSSGTKADVKKKPWKKLDGKVPKNSKSDTRSHKVQRERMILQERAFKDLDTTMTVLGIEGGLLAGQPSLDADPCKLNSLSPEPLTPVKMNGSPAVDLRPREQGGSQSQPQTPRLQSQESERSESTSVAPPIPRSISEGVIKRPGVLSFSREDSGEQLPGQERAEPTPRHSSSPASFSSKGRRSRKRDVNADNTFLQSERQEWRDTLAGVLEGRLVPEDSASLLQDTLSQARELAEELTESSSGAADTWTEREQHLAWLHTCIVKARSIMREVPQDDHQGMLTVCAAMWPSIVEFSSAICASTCVGLDVLSPANDDELRMVGRIARLCVDYAGQICTKLRDNHILLADCEYEALLGAHVEGVVAALTSHAHNLQDTLLSGDVLMAGRQLATGSGSGMSAHEINTSVRLLPQLWKMCAELVKHVGRGWPERRVLMQQALCECLNDAAAAATLMLPADTSELAESSDDECESSTSSSTTVRPQGYGTMGVWGEGLRCGRGVSDEEVQAQSWVPSLLHALLTRSQEAHERLRVLLTAHDTPDLSQEKEEEILSMMDDMHGVWFEVVLGNTQRVAGLCAGQESLACWALEVLKEMAEQALRLVQDYDKCCLGLGYIIKATDDKVKVGRLFATLKRSTDDVVNSYMRLRRLLKLKRTDQPAPVPVPVRLRSKPHTRPPHPTNPKPTPQPPHAQPKGLPAPAPTSTPTPSPVTPLPPKTMSPFGSLAQQKWPSPTSPPTLSPEPPSEPESGSSPTSTPTVVTSIIPISSTTMRSSIINDPFAVSSPTPVPTTKPQKQITAPPVTSNLTHAFIKLTPAPTTGPPIQKLLTAPNNPSQSVKSTHSSAHNGPTNATPTQPSHLSISHRVAAASSSSAPHATAPLKLTNGPSADSVSEDTSSSVLAASPTPRTWVSILRQKSGSAPSTTASSANQPPSADLTFPTTVNRPASRSPAAQAGTTSAMSSSPAIPRRPSYSELPHTPSPSAAAPPSRAETTPCIPSQNGASPHSPQVTSQQPQHSISHVPQQITSSQAQRSTAQHPKHSTSHQPQQSTTHLPQNGIPHQSEHNTSHQTQHDISHPSQRHMTHQIQHSISHHPQHGTSHLPQNGVHHQTDSPSHTITLAANLISSSSTHSEHLLSRLPAGEPLINTAGVTLRGGIMATSAISAVHSYSDLQSASSTKDNQHVACIAAADNTTPTSTWQNSITSSTHQGGEDTAVTVPDMEAMESFTSVSNPPSSDPEHLNLASPFARQQTEHPKHLRKNSALFSSLEPAFSRTFSAVLRGHSSPSVVAGDADAGTSGLENALTALPEGTDGVALPTAHDILNVAGTQPHSQHTQHDVTADDARDVSGSVQRENESECESKVADGQVAQNGVTVEGQDSKDSNDSKVDEDGWFVVGAKREQPSRNPPAARVGASNQRTAAQVGNNGVASSSNFTANNFARPGRGGHYRSQSSPAFDRFYDLSSSPAHAAQYSQHTHLLGMQAMLAATARQAGNVGYDPPGRDPPTHTPPPHDPPWLPPAALLGIKTHLATNETSNLHQRTNLPVTPAESLPSVPSLGETIYGAPSTLAMRLRKACPYTSSLATIPDSSSQESLPHSAMLLPDPNAPTPSTSTSSSGLNALGSSSSNHAGLSTPAAYPPQGVAGPQPGSPTTGLVTPEAQQMVGGQWSVSAEDEFWSIQWAHLAPSLVRKLGSGSYGQVWQGVYHGADVAIKVINIDFDSGLGEETVLRFKREVDLQRRLSHHPNVVRFIGACCEFPQSLLRRMHGAVIGDMLKGVKLAIVMELCRMGSLFDVIRQARQVARLLKEGAKPADVKRQLPNGFQFYHDWVTRLEVLRGAAAGVHFMHSHNVVHRDLTSYNLLLDYGKPWQVKVADFNLSRMISDGQQLWNSGNPNSPGWQSPELLKGDAYGKEADVFSFGVIVWEAVTLKEPWRDEVEGHTVSLYYIMNSVIDGKRLEFPPHGEIAPTCVEMGEVIQLAKECWCQEPSYRPQLGEVAARLTDIIANMKDRLRKQRMAERPPANH